MKQIGIFIIGLVIGIIGTMTIMTNNKSTKVNIDTDKYKYQKDSLTNIINNNNKVIDSLINNKSKIDIRYETLYNYMLVANDDSVIRYISAKIYNR